MKAIVAAIDLSPVTRRVTEAAARLARAMQAEVVLCTVLVEPVYLLDYAPMVEGLARITVRRASIVRRQLATIERHLRKAGVHAVTSLRRGVPAEEILREVEARQASHLLIGSHGHSAFRELVAGSTASTLLRGSRCPLVIVPAPRPVRRRRPRGIPPSLYLPWSLTP